ncbi:MAG: AbrB/MazE/SpoVT family DNA-binding domain-containing protein [Alphaproteobacteria bacterium]|nr:AbrB/MazE/SpoVT family DNA-binding domain-containing protein [Alphaproteobacteria bacterium]
MIDYKNYGKLWDFIMLGIRARIGKGGRIVIPAEYRRELQLETGEEIILYLENGELSAFTLKHAIKQAQSIVKKHNPKNRVLTHELKELRQNEEL